MLLDRSIYEGIEHDRRALPQAIATVLLSSAAAGVGVAGWRGPDPMVMAVGAGLSMLVWVVWASLMFQIGGHLMPVRDTQTSLAELLRTLGFAAAPGLLQAFGALPHVTVPVFIVAWVWMFAASVVAVRQALDYGSTARTLVVSLAAASISLGVAVVIGVMLSRTVN